MWWVRSQRGHTENLGVYSKTREAGLLEVFTEGRTRWESRVETGNQEGVGTLVQVRDGGRRDQKVIQVGRSGQILGLF